MDPLISLPIMSLVVSGIVTQPTRNLIFFFIVPNSTFVFSGKVTFKPETTTRMTPSGQAPEGMPI